MEKIKPLTRDKYMLFEEADKVLKYLDRVQHKSDYYRRAHCLVNILFWTRARASEAKNIKMKDIDLDGMFIRVIGKGGKKRELLLTPDLVEILRYYLKWKKKKGEGLEPDDYLVVNKFRKNNTYQSVLNMWRKVLKESRIKREYGVHASRHTFSFRVYDQTKNVVFLSQLLGHSDIQTTMVYTQYNVNKMTDVLNGLWR